MLKLLSMGRLQHKKKIIGTFYGEVSVYRDHELNMDVAVKSFNLSSKDSDRESIMVEHNMMAMLSKSGGHINIVHLHYAIMEPSKMYLVMEYCVTGDLCTFLEVQKSLRPSTSAAIFSQITSGVYFLHSSGYAHRKLSLDNVLIDPHNEICKLCDFGSVVPANQLCFRSAGRKRYMAPEVTKRKCHHACEADTWSLGIILFALLTGKFLFKRAAKGFPAYDYFIQNGLVGLTNKYKLSHLIPPSAMDLLERILQVGPALRISITAIMDHPFVIGQKRH